MTNEKQSPARYVVGFDLGTTNSAVCYVDTQETPWRVRTFAVPQLVAAGQVEARETLPSFHYQFAAGETAAKGEGGRGEGGKEKGKSPFCIRRWFLCPRTKARWRRAGPIKLGQIVAVPFRRGSNGGLLPWHGAEDVEKLSPVEVSARYLAHVRAGLE